MDIIEKYLTKIIKKTLTHSEIIVIAMSIETAIESQSDMKGIAFFIPTLKTYGLSINQRKAVARLMLDELKEVEERRKPNPFDYQKDNETTPPDF
jgi:hypothetical protein